MQVQYLGPLMMGLGHPALTGYDLGSFPPSCFAVELKKGAGFNGPLIEGDVLIADEDRLATNDDLAIAKVEGEHLLARNLVYRWTRATDTAAGTGFAVRA